MKSKSGIPIRTPQEQGRPLNGPIQVGGRVAEHMVQTAYNAQHKINWHWELPSYLVTKNIAGGLFMLLSLGAMFNVVPFHVPTFLVVGFTAMVFMLLTVILLIKDLSQPKRFLNILLRPQWKSWVARGAFILIGFTAVAGLWWLLEAAAYFGSSTTYVANWGVLANGLVIVLRPIFAWITFPLALFSVIYSAFLLGQAEGRDLWQSPLLPFQLFSQSIMAGSGIFLVLGIWISLPSNLFADLRGLFVTSMLVNLTLTLSPKFTTFASEVAQLASREMTHGQFRNHFWWGGIALGHIIPLTLILALTPAFPVAVVCSLIGLFFYEYAFVMAPQYIPNS